MAHLGEAGGFTRSAMESCSIRESIKELAFIKELCDGTLPQETFAFYLTQDSLYLREYSKVLAMLAAKAPRPEITQLMGSAANTALLVEGALHAVFLKGKGANAERSPTCEGYTNFLTATAHSKPYEVAFAAAIPCYTIYCEVGEHILRQVDQASLAGHPFAEWIKTYGGEAFETATRKAVAVLDDLAAGATPAVRQEMMRAFMQAARFEWMFWHSAYVREPWPINLPAGTDAAAVGALTAAAAAPSPVHVARYNTWIVTASNAGVKSTLPSAALWKATAPAAAAALHGRFCSALAAGTMPAASFGLYIAQDHFFLKAFADAYASAASLLPVSYQSTHGPLVALLVQAVNEERDGHAANAAKWGITDLSAVEPLDATKEYCALLSAAAASGSLGVLFAAAAPCMRLYAHLGQQLKPVAASDSAYLEWIDAYASSEFEEAAAAAETLLDTFGGDKSGGGLSGEEADAYHAAMRLEVAFFDQVACPPFQASSCA